MTSTAVPTPAPNPPGFRPSILARLIAAFFPGMKTNSVPVLSGVTLLLIAIALIASYMPARYASRISPIEALRAE